MNEYKKYNRIGKIFDNLNNDEEMLVALESFVTTYNNGKSNGHPTIPLSIFSDPKLGILEATTKYMKENLSMKFSSIARYLKRDESTIWATYNNAVMKKKAKFEVADSKIDIPCDIFSERKLGPLESLSIYLKDQTHLSIHDISTQLNRKYMTIYLSYNNGKKKK